MANEGKLPGPIHTSELDEVWRLYRAWDNGGGGAAWSALANRLIQGDAAHDPLLPRILVALDALRDHLPGGE
jgi:hypothetical protein